MIKSFPARVARLRDLAEEAIATLELRRTRRWLQRGWSPVLTFAGAFGAVWLLAGALGGPLAWGLPGAQGGQLAFAGLLGAAGAVALFAAQLRAAQYWRTEQRLDTLRTWLLSEPRAGRSIRTVVASSAGLGVLLTLVPLGLMSLVGAFSGVQPWQLLLGLALLVACALLGGSLGSAGFFIGARLASRRGVAVGGALLLLLILGLWVRLTVAEQGWLGPLDEHGQRFLRALLLVTPLPGLFAAGLPEWWSTGAARWLQLPVPAWQGALFYLLFVLFAAGAATWLASHALEGLRRDPERLDTPPPAEDAREDPGREVYWRGFRNPVWTREIRTRIRSRETAEFIFFASVAVAAAFFGPLLWLVQDLDDPLRTAAVARVVFFWVTMVLVALVVLVTPGLAVEGMITERDRNALEMLITTPLRAGEILMGKLLGAFCVVALLISPSLPLFALCSLFHGAELGQILAVYAVLGMSVLVTGLLGATSAVLQRNPLTAKLQTFGMTAVYAAAPGGPFWLGATISFPEASVRSELLDMLGLSLLLATFGLLVVALLWGMARERLERIE